MICARLFFTKKKFFRSFKFILITSLNTHQVLNDIAKKSNGGTFSLSNPGDLSVVFSQCLGGLLSVLVQEVKLILTPQTDKVSRREKVTTKINKVYAGNYPQSTDAATGIVTVTFGDLYQSEIRTVLVDLFLPAVSKEVDLDALEIVCSYRFVAKISHILSLVLEN